MIFKNTYEEVLAGIKTQTRRLCRSTTDFQNVHNDQVGEVVRSGRLLWRVGRTYAIQAGRGIPGLGRIRLLRIRAEQLCEISAEDCMAEGLITFLREAEAVIDLRHQFQMLWDGIHALRGERWVDNPAVWVLAFELEPSDKRT
jgi:hypothetical protein